jgi:IS30 family transposase
VYYSPIVASGPDQYQCDLTFFDQHKRHNNGFGIIIVFVEITTRKAYCYPLKNKISASICEAYKLFLNDVNNKVHNITTDNGSEFISKEFKKIDEANKIIHNYMDAGDKTSMGKS